MVDLTGGTREWKRKGKTICENSNSMGGGIRSVQTWRMSIASKGLLGSFFSASGKNLV